MKYRTLGQSGIEASVVAMGTWAIGGWMWGGTDEKSAIEAIQAGIDQGINLIDTAPIYGFGRSEEIVGKAIKDCRDKVVLATKCGLVWDTDKGDFYFHSDERSPTATANKMEVHKYLGAESVKREVEASLKRLGTDYIDLLQTHWQETTTPIEETMGAMLKLKEQGKIRAIGVCNALPEQLKRYCAVGAMDSDQERFSMLDRKIEPESLPYCRENHIAVLAYSPMELGLLTGKIGPERKFGPGDQRASNPKFTPENLEKVAAMLAEFSPVTEEHGISIAQLVIAWTVSPAGVTHALCGVRNPEQAKENARAAEVTFTTDELALIDRAIRRYLESIKA